MPDPKTEKEIFDAAGGDDSFMADAPAETPTEAPKPEPEPKPDAAPEPEPQPDVEQPQQPEIPRGDLSVALREEREARKQLRAELEQERADRARLMQMLERSQPPQQQAPKDEPPPDFWSNPDKFVANALTPVQQAINQQNERFSRMMAVQTHGQETVQAAYQAMAEEARRDPSAQVEVQRIMQSDHPYGELVSWHQRRKLQQEIGSDPEAYRQKVIADYLASQPAPEGAAVPQPAGGSPAPVNAGLPSLNRAIGNAGAPQGGAITEDDIFNAAPAFGRRKA